MASQPTFDPGLTQQYTGTLRRAINPDGSFNVLRSGLNWRDRSPYVYLITTTWPRFFTWMLLGYLMVNIIFALLYYVLGDGALQGGIEQHSDWERFLNGFFFSSHTLTTVGFGSIAPHTPAANMMAAGEAMIGLLAFAVATGLLFGRVSQPTARIGFSSRAIIAPYQNGQSLMFRIVNRRVNALMELQARVILMTVSGDSDQRKREYRLLNLERPDISFFPLTWTVVHAINDESPLFGKTAEDLERSQAEFLIMIKAWDETFGQTVIQRYSYRFDEITWGAKFDPAFAINEHGDMVLQIDRVSDHSQI